MHLPLKKRHQAKSEISNFPPAKFFKEHDSDQARLVNKVMTVSGTVLGCCIFAN